MRQHRLASTSASQDSRVASQCTAARCPPQHTHARAQQHKSAHAVIVFLISSTFLSQLSCWNSSCYAQIYFSCVRCSADSSRFPPSGDVAAGAADGADRDQPAARKMWSPSQQRVQNVRKHMRAKASCPQIVMGFELAHAVGAECRVNRVAAVGMDDQLHAGPRRRHPRMLS